MCDFGGYKTEEEKKEAEKMDYDLGVRLDALISRLDILIAALTKETEEKPKTVQK